MRVSRNSAAPAGRGEAGVQSVDPGFGLYVHWPFCASKCPYCDFNSHVAETVDHRRWRRALLAELDHFAERTRGRRLASVFFGGGTPSLMDPATVADLITAARGHWPGEDDPEITLEANPSSAEAERFQDFRDSGVNRLSLGVQSFRDETLAFLGRGHLAAEARAAIGWAADHFPRFSFDLIYGLPDQPHGDWRRDVAEALDLAGDHLSLYQLTIEPGTPFHRTGVAAADEDRGAELFEITQDMLGGAGFPAYEISNHAAAGGECRHNLNGWLGGDYVGVGPGAHGRLSENFRTEAIHQVHLPERWLAAVEATGHGTGKRRPLSPEARRDEVLMTGLRLRDGVDRKRFAAVTGGDLEDAVDGGGLRRMVEGGFLEADGTRIRATAAGRLRLNEVLRQLLAGPSPASSPASSPGAGT